VERAVPSSLRLHSQAYSPRGEPPLSGFLADSSFAALFHAATVPGVLPPEVSPHGNRAPLSRPLLLPCGYPPTCWNVASWTLSPPVSPTPTLLAQLPGSPDDYGLPFHAPRCASRSPWIQAAEPLRSASFTRFEALILPRVRSRRPELPRVAGRSSPGFFASLKLSPSTPRDPRTRPGREDLNMPLRPQAPGHDSRDFDTPPAG